MLVSDTLFPGQTMLAVANGLVLDALDVRESALDFAKLWGSEPNAGWAWYGTASYPSGALMEFRRTGERKEKWAAFGAALELSGYRKEKSFADGYLQENNIDYALYTGPMDEAILLSCQDQTIRVGYSPVEIAPKRHWWAPFEKEPMASWLIPASRAEAYEGLSAAK